MNTINISTFEDNFLGMIQKNINMFSRKTQRVQVINKNYGRSKIGQIKESINTINKQITALEQLRKKKERELQDALA